MKTLLCLHGWGASGASFNQLRAALANTDIKILTPDIPGFGDAPEPEHPWTITDFAQWTADFIKENIGDEPYEVLGHSNGGRTLIKLFGDPNLENCQLGNLPAHMYLCAASGIRHPRHFKRVVGLTLAKAGKLLLSIPGLNVLQPLGKKLLYKLVRVHDYEKASPLMQQTLIEVSKEDLRPLLKNITVPVDLFWGLEDGMTPYQDAQVMEAEIAHSNLHSYAQVRHGVHRDKAAEIAEIVVARSS